MHEDEGDVNILPPRDNSQGRAGSLIKGEEPSLLKNSRNNANVSS